MIFHNSDWKQEQLIHVAKKREKKQDYLVVLGK